MIEPLAVGLQAVGKANIKPGFIGLVLGCGPIGIVTALSAIVGGCSKVFVADILDKKLQICEKYNGLIPIDITKNNLNEIISDETNGWGVDVLFEASGATQAYDEIIHNICQYISLFHTLHEHEIELLFFTDKLIRTVNTN